MGKGARIVARQYTVPFILITSLFFMWGFVRALLDVLNKHFQGALELSKMESSFIQFSMYAAYFLIAIPAGLYINKYGYRRGVVFGLLLFGIGALLFIPAEAAMTFYFFLGALFVIGSGLVFLETAANPYVTELGAPNTATSRLNLSQSFNGLGCFLAPMIGGWLLFSDPNKAQVALPYAVMGVIVLIVAFVFSRVQLPEIKKVDAESQDQGSMKGLWQHRTFVFGLIALLCYEISEISINSFFINYVTDDDWLTPLQASLLLSVGALLLFMCARVIGSVIMSFVAASKVLLVCGVMTVICTFLIVCNVGIVSKISLFAVYAFEAIMFPTMFAMALHDVGHYTKRAASFLMMTPIGGAIGTLLMGWAADSMGMSAAFIVPLLGYAVVLAFAVFANQGRRKAAVKA